MIKAVLLDFDGTISTLRCGWEAVMRQVMLRYLPGRETDIDRYIDESTGIQTVFQMKWLSAQVAEAGGAARDPWTYKDEYNRALMVDVEEKKAALRRGAVSPEDYLIAGSRRFLLRLRERGIPLYVASGTDDADVKAEAAALGVADCFTLIQGAPYREEGCSKEAVMTRLLEEAGYRGSELAVIGDGKVEIALGRARGAVTVGLATDERRRRGVNPVKEARLRAAGAQRITGDFLDDIFWREALGL